jgi:hypothetical protein
MNTLSSMFGKAWSLVGKQVEVVEPAPSMDRDQVENSLNVLEEQT